MCSGPKFIELIILIEVKSCFSILNAKPTQTLMFATQIGASEWISKIVVTDPLTSSYIPTSLHSIVSFIRAQ